MASGIKILLSHAINYFFLQKYFRARTAQMNVIRNNIYGISSTWDLILGHTTEVLKNLFKAN